MPHRGGALNVAPGMCGVRPQGLGPLSSIGYVSKLSLACPHSMAGLDSSVLCIASELTLLILCLLSDRPWT